MIKSLTGLAFRFFRENKFIAVSSILSVAISISLIITMALFVSNAKQSLVEEVQQMFGNMDLAVGYNPEQEKVIDTDLLSEITSHEAIEQSSNVLLTRKYVDKLGDTVYTIGAENDSLAKSRYHFTEDISEDELILNKRLAESLSVQAGDTMMLENRTYTVKEITPDLEAAGPVTDTLILAKNRIQQVEFEKTGINQEATYILMKVKEGRDLQELVAGLKSVDPDLRIDIAEEDGFVKSNLDMLNQFIIVLSILVLILTSLFIVSNFEVFLYKYKNQLAIMRALGATTRQIFTVVFLQSSLINVSGAIVAFILVIVTHQFIQNWFGPLFSISLTQNDFNFGMAIGVICISILLIQTFMLIPAYRSSKVLPLAIMQENEAINLPYQKLHNSLGIGLLAASIIVILLGVIFSNLVLLVLLGALFLVIGMFLLLPAYITPILKRFLPLIKSVFGNTSFITVKNLIPQVRKNILVVMIIAAMMIIAVFGSAFIQTIQHNDEQYVKKQFPTDIVLTGSISNESAELESVVNELESIESVSTHSSFYSAEVTIGNNRGELVYAYADLKEMEKQGLVPDMGEVDASKIIMRQEIADRYGLEVGDEIQAELFFESSVDVITVASIVEEFPNFGDFLIDWQNNPDEPVFQMAFVQSSDGESALNQLQQIKSQFPLLNITSYEQSLEQSKQIFAQRWSIFIVVLAVILFSVMLGVVNTLVNNIHSRRKEYAILRAISLSKKGIIQVIMTQVTTYLLIGILFGSLTGVILTYVISLVDPGTIQFDFRLMGLLIGVMVAISLLVFVPFANKIGILTISEELTKDNK